MNLNKIIGFLMISALVVGVSACGKKDEVAPAVSPVSDKANRTEAEVTAAVEAALKAVSDEEEKLKNLGLEVSADANGVWSMAAARTEVTVEEQLTALKGYVASLENADLKAEVATAEVAALVQAKLALAQAKKAELEASLNPAPAPAPAVDPAPAPAVDPAPAPAVDPAPAGN